MQTEGNKIHFTSLGCARNLVDTEVMLGLALRAGYELTADLKEADYLVVNTCGFLAESRRESSDTIDELLRERKAGAKVIAAGCMVQKMGPSLHEQFPSVHYFLGSGEMERILEAITSEKPGEAITSNKSYLEWGEVPRQVSTPKHFAYLKIAEGCLKRCSFCIIPQIKGNLRSKPKEQVLKEFHTLLSQGAREIILIAQDLGDYGKDRKEPRALADLLRELLKTKGDFWIRLLYLYPDEVDDELISLLASDRRLLPYLDMPLQHINNRVLKSMRRKTSREEIIEILTKLRGAIPDIVIRTSLMVGFPGETEEEFEELVAFVGEHPIDNVGIFKYSKEEESHSATLPNHLSEEVKEQRFQKLASAQLKSAREHSKKWVGKTLEVVVEGYHRESKHLMRGRFYGQCPDIDGEIIINDGRKVTAFGERYEVEITSASGYDLVGRVVAPLRQKRAKLCLASA